MQADITVLGNDCAAVVMAIYKTPACLMHSSRPPLAGVGSAGKPYRKQLRMNKLTTTCRKRLCREALQETAVQEQADCHLHRQLC
jgi:hypothetical protein